MIGWMMAKTSAVGMRRSRDKVATGQREYVAYGVTERSCWTRLLDTGVVVVGHTLAFRGRRRDIFAGASTSSSAL